MNNFTRANETNEVTVKGKVMYPFEYHHTVRNTDFYATQVKIPRLSDVSDTLVLIVSENLLDITKDYTGKSIRVFGHFRSRNQMEGDRNKLLLYVFGKEIEIVEEDTKQQVQTNEIYLDGFICKPPVFRETPRGREIADALIAVNRPAGGSDYIPCIFWEKNAHRVSELNVGDHIAINGRIQSREYTKVINGTEREERVAYEVSVGTFTLLPDERKKQNPDSLQPEEQEDA